MKLTMTSLGAPVGTYRAKFVGVKPREPMEGTDYGPGLEWRFEVIEGPQKGNIAARTTSQEPTLKNACGRMLSGIAGGVLAMGQEFDPDTYLGHVYVITVETNSTGSGTRVGTVMPAGAFGSSPDSRFAGTPPAAPPVAPPPPPPQQPPIAVHGVPRGPQPAPGNVPEPRYWVADSKGGPPLQMAAEELRRVIKDQQLDPAALMVCQVGSQQWLPAAGFGFECFIPF